MYTIYILIQCNFEGILTMYTFHKVYQKLYSYLALGICLNSYLVTIRMYAL